MGDLGYLDEIQGCGFLKAKPFNLLLPSNIKKVIPGAQISPVANDQCVSAAMSVGQSIKPVMVG